jgi:hypothetical protein
MLSDTQLRQAKGTGKRQRLYDARGLYLEITPPGERSGDSSTGLKAERSGSGWGDILMFPWRWLGSVERKRVSYWLEG